MSNVDGGEWVGSHTHLQVRSAQKLEQCLAGWALKLFGINGAVVVRISHFEPPLNKPEVLGSPKPAILIGVCLLQFGFCQAAAQLFSGEVLILVGSSLSKVFVAALCASVRSIVPSLSGSNSLTVPCAAAGATRVGTAEGIPRSARSSAVVRRNVIVTPVSRAVVVCADATGPSPRAEPGAIRHAVQGSSGAQIVSSPTRGQSGPAYALVLRTKAFRPVASPIGVLCLR